MRKPWCEDCLKNSASIGSTVHLRGSAPRSSSSTSNVPGQSRSPWLPPPWLAEPGVAASVAAPVRTTLNERPRPAVNVPRPAASTR